MITPPAGRLATFAAVALFIATGRPAPAYQDPGDIPPDAPPGAHREPDAEAPEVPAGMDVLTRGPVHEAFAEPVVYDPRPGPVIPKPPPDPVEELPPDQKPEGANVVWIPGYWAWDDGRNDFLWISGLWRAAPPGRQWVPGYWNQAEGGFQWVPGAWVPIDQDQSQPVGQYLPVPPQSLESGPNGPPPGDGFTWAPGLWYWQEARYVWRPGYWVPLQENWVWVPEHYVWTPSGCLFVPGYWDRTLARRGVLFAPVYFSQPIYAQPGFVYRPTIGLMTTALLSSLFVRPSYHQYYFGDYYAPAAFQSGIYPWFSFHQSRYGYDPIYSHYRAVNLQSDPRWDDEMRRAYLYRRDHVEARPPRTFAQQQAIVKNVAVNNVRNVNNVNNLSNVALARPVNQLASSDALPVRFERLGHDRHQELAQQARALQQFRAERLRQESRGAQVQVRAAEAPQPRRIELPRSPVAADPRGGRHVDLPPKPTLPRPIETVQPPPPGHPHQRPEPRADFRPHREAMRPRLGVPGQPGFEGIPGTPASPPAPAQPGRAERRVPPGRQPKRQEPGANLPGQPPGTQPAPMPPGRREPGEPPKGQPRRDRASRRQTNRFRGDLFGQPGDFGQPAFPGFGMPSQPAQPQPDAFPGGQPFAGQAGTIPGFPSPGSNGQGQAQFQQHAMPGVAHPAPEAPAPHTGHQRENPQHGRPGKQGPKRD